MHSNKKNASADVNQSRPGPRERLWPMLWRRLSTCYYRRSGRYGRHRALVGDDQMLPLPPLEDELTMYFLDRLPSGLLGGDQMTAARRYARVFTAVIGVFVALIGIGFAAARLVKRAIRSRPVDPHGVFVTRAPVGNAGVDLGPVRLVGYEVNGESMTCYWQRRGSVANTCQIFVHLYPAHPNEFGPVRHIYKDHTPDCPMHAWPKRRVYVDEVCLRDLAPGSYRIVVGIIDVVRRERFVITENGQTTVELGWYDLNGVPAVAPAPRKEVSVASA